MKLLRLGISIVFDTIPAILLAGVVIIISIDVTGRYIFHTPFRGSNEIALMCFIGVVYLSSVSVMRDRSHISIDALARKLPTRWAAVLVCFTSSLIVVVLAVLALRTWGYVTSTKFTAFPLTGVSRGVFATILLISLVAMAAYAVRDVIWAARGAVSGDFELPETVTLDAVSDVDTATLQVLDTKPISISLIESDDLNEETSTRGERS